MVKSLIPSMTSLSLKEALAMDLRGYQITEKKDGVTAVQSFNEFEVVGEKMPNGEFFAFDVIKWFDKDTSRLSLRERQLALNVVSAMGWSKTVPQGYGVEFIEAIFANPYSEGVVLKNWDSPFGYGWAKVKRSQTFDVRVTDKFRGSVSIEYENQSAGRVALAGANLEAVQVGQVIEISAFKRNVSGKFREPRFVRIRHDKL